MTRRWYFFLTSYFQVQVYWSESPKAKFVKQGEVDQVNHHSGLTEYNRSGDVNNHSNPKHHWNLFSGFLHCKAHRQRQEGEMVFPRPGEDHPRWCKFYPTCNFTRCAWKERSTRWCSPTAPSPSPSTSQRPLTLDDTSDTSTSNILVFVFLN